MTLERNKPQIFSLISTDKVPQLKLTFEKSIHGLLHGKRIFHILYFLQESAVARFLFLKKQQNGKPSLTVSMCVGKGVKVFHVRIQLRFTTIVT